MRSSAVFVVSAMLVAYAAGVPVIETEMRQYGFEAQGGSHLANIYTDLDCSGTTLVSVKDFGCGGECYTFSAASSILLKQDTTGNPKPTAELFASNDCSGSSTHAGIYSGEHSGCSNARNEGLWRSAYLYFDCHH